jgi:hypothetical protein
MRNGRYHGLKKEGHSMNQFNDSEYERWSEQFKATESLQAQSGIESFLGTSENLQPGREDISVSLIKIGEK